MSNPELIISVLILVAIGVAAFLGQRQGAANPIGTGKLQRDVSELRGRLGKIEQSVSAIRRDVDATPTKEDIARLAGQVETNRAIAEKTDQAVVRIEQLLMERALPRNGG